MANIVLSYRRADSKWIAGRIFDRLESHFGRGHVFMDIDNVPIGLDYRDHIRGILAKCDVLVAVIGPNWAGLDTSGNSRLSDEADWVRIEISSAIARKIPIVPLLVDGTPMPQSGQLPPEVAELAFRQAVNLDSGVDFDNHMRRLTTSLDRLLAGKPISGAPPGANRGASPPVATASEAVSWRPPRALWPWLAAAAVLPLIAGYAAFLLRPVATPDPRPPPAAETTHVEPVAPNAAMALNGATSPFDVSGQWCRSVDGRLQQLVIVRKPPGEISSARYDDMVAERRADDAKFIRSDNAAYWAYFERISPDQIKGTIATPAGITPNIIYGQCKP